MTSPSARIQPQTAANQHKSHGDTHGLYSRQLLFHTCKQTITQHASDPLHWTDCLSHPFPTRACSDEYEQQGYIRGPLRLPGAAAILVI
jgi:hypothetical protein